MPMSRRTLLRCAKAALLLPLVACESRALKDDGSGLGGEAGASGDPTLVWEDFPGRLAEVQCAALERCCAAASIEFTRATCQPDLSTAFERAFEDLRALNTRYDADMAARCVTALEAQFADCRIDPTPDVDAACGNVFEGALAIGDICVDDAECADSQAAATFCKAELGTATDSCQPRLLEGETCFLAGCDSGLFCDINSLTCVPSVTNGECFLITDCPNDAFCSVNLRCEPKRDGGASCVNDLECKSGICGNDALCQSDLATPSSCAG